MSGAPWSMRRRLIVGNLVSMLLVLGGIGVAVHQVAEHESEEIFSARLATSARVLDALVTRQLEHATITHPIVIDLPRELEHFESEEPEVYGHAYETKIAFQVWHQEGRLLARSASAPDEPLGPLAAGFHHAVNRGQAWETFALPSGPVWVIAAEKDGVRQELANDLGISILVPLAAGGLLMLALANLVLSLNMRSLRELAARISRREATSLAPISLLETPVELVPIVKELNALLERVRSAFERERQFIDAAAHEIRTPIAALQIHVQNALHAPDQQERQRSLTDALTALRRTTKLAEQLLAFSRLSAGADTEVFQTVSLKDICCNVIAAQEPLIAERGQTIALEMDEAADDDCTIHGDRYKLERLLQNLIDNASQYGASAGEIRVALWRRGGRIELSVANDGAPIPEGERERIFAPYYRILGNRATGSGLGLAIVKEIAGQHAANICVRTKEDGQGAVFVVDFAAEKMRTAA